jgi:hypothetical protein
MDQDKFKEVVRKVEALKLQYAARDYASMQVRAVRHGDFDQISTGIFPEDWPRPVCANIVDNMARDFAAKMTPLPSFNCSSASSLSDVSKKFADKRSKIANNYVIHSHLAAQMAEAADSYNCYGMVAFSVEPDFDAKLPRIRVEDSLYIYPLWNRNMETIAAAKIHFQYANAIEADYPLVVQARKDHPGALVGGDRYKVVRYSDKDDTVVYLPDLGNFVLHEYKNPTGRCGFVCVPRPSGAGTYGQVLRGQYDDLVWPQLARNEFQILALEAADKAVRAPIIIPTDVTDVAFGPDATIQTNNPQGVQRLKVDVPPASFQAMEWLRQDMQLGGMTNEGRSGQTSASVITGAGMDALQEGFSTQQAQAQEMMRFALLQVMELCFYMDEKLWPKATKEIRGQDAGVPYKVTYTPNKDIAGDHTIDIQYGFLAGMDANRSLIFILQAYGAGLLSGDYAMRNLPANFNVSEEAKKIELEKIRKALMESLAASSQALPQMIAQGADPSKLIASIAAIAAGIKKGEAIEDIVTKVFAPPPPAPAAPAPGEGMPGDPSSPGGPPGSEPGAAAGSPPGLPGQPPGGPQQTPQAGAQPPGRPDLMQLMAAAGTGGGAPNLGVGIKRSVVAA